MVVKIHTSYHLSRRYSGLGHLQQWANITNIRGHILHIIYEAPLSFWKCQFLYNQTWLKPFGHTNKTRPTADTYSQMKEVHL